jgi:hypothetical protein
MAAAPNDSGVRLPVGVRNISIVNSFDFDFVTHLCTPVKGRIVPKGVNRQGRETNHSHPSDTEIKNCRAVPPLPHVAISCIIEHKHKFTS